MWTTGGKRLRSQVACLAANVNRPPRHHWPGVVGHHLQQRPALGFALLPCVQFLDGFEQSRLLVVAQGLQLQ